MKKTKVLLIAACAVLVANFAFLIDYFWLSRRVSSDEEKMGYAIGMQIAGNLERDANTLDRSALALAIHDAGRGSAPRLSPEEAAAAIRLYQDRAQKSAGAAAEANRQTGRAYLEKNAERKEVKTLPSGLQIETLSAGEGPSPQAGTALRLHYRATLVDGTLFDDTHRLANPLELQLNQLMPGLRQGVEKMKTGEKAKLYIPTDLAFGNESRPGIPPGSVLVYELELVQARVEHTKGKK